MIGTVILVGLVAMTSSLAAHFYLNDIDPWRRNFFWLQRLAELMLVIGTTVFVCSSLVGFVEYLH